METRRGQQSKFQNDDDGPIKVSGYAAVFNERTSIGGYFDEQIAPGAFKDAINRDDVVFLINHEGLPLARTRSGTLALKEDQRGLHMTTELDANDPDVLTIVPKMERGDLDKMSFAFRAEVEEWDESGDTPLRTIKQVTLFDVSIVTQPAYDSTEIGLRSLNAFRVSRAGTQNTRKRRLLTAALRHRIAWRFPRVRPLALGQGNHERQP